MVDAVSGREIVFEEIAKPNDEAGGVRSLSIWGLEVEDEGGEQVSQRSVWAAVGGWPRTTFVYSRRSTRRNWSTAPRVAAEPMAEIRPKRSSAIAAARVPGSRKSASNRTRSPAGRSSLNC